MSAGCCVSCQALTETLADHLCAGCKSCPSVADEFDSPRQYVVTSGYFQVEAKDLPEPVDLVGVPVWVCETRAEADALADWHNDRSDHHWWAVVCMKEA